ncbi:MAG: tyrosine-type recombinase/integrase [Kiritimatiellae bacterium]|nr:tyrosine-type recombinase/integrase [Kiritimatiellia bacterium]MCO5068567.1 tyrosine-type recombinase/integrase [Kiritimatiellia bacterium]
MHDVILHDLQADFLRHLEARRYSPFSIRVHRSHLRAWVRWLEERFAVRRVEQLRREHLEAWLHHLQARRTPQGLPLKARSINKHIEAVRLFLRRLRQQGLIHPDLPDAIAFLKQPQMLPQSVLTHAQVRRMLARVKTSHATGYRDRAMLELLYSSGIRAGELLKLNVSDIDLKSATALVHGKGDKQRLVPIGRTALRHLETYLVAVRPYLLCDAGEQALFLNRRGLRMKYETLLLTIKASAEPLAAEFSVSPHTFRRSCTTELIRGGANLYHVKELLGHETLDTLHHYVRLTIADLKKTHEKCHPRERDEGD